MQIIGAALVANGTIVQEWDHVPPVVVYNGETRTGMIVGAQMHDALLVERVAEMPPPGPVPVVSSQSAWDGARVVVTRAFGAVDIVAVKAETKMAISVAAENARSKYITPGSGKAMSYQQVAAEARTYVTTGGAGVYPFLQARVSSGRYADLAAAAAGTIAIEQQWAAVGSAIDRVEDQAKLAIDAAASVEQVQSATQVTWP